MCIEPVLRPAWATPDRPFAASNDPARGRGQAQVAGRQAGLLRQRNELVGRHEAVHRMHPADERLDAGHPAGRDLEDRLEVEDELLRGDGSLEGLGERVPGRDGRCHERLDVSLEHERLFGQSRAAALDDRERHGKRTPTQAVVDDQRERPWTLERQRRSAG